MEKKEFYVKPEMKEIIINGERVLGSASDVNPCETMGDDTSLPAECIANPDEDF